MLACNWRFSDLENLTMSKVIEFRQRQQETAPKMTAANPDGSRLDAVYEGGMWRLLIDYGPDEPGPGYREIATFEDRAAVDALWDWVSRHR